MFMKQTGNMEKCILISRPQSSLQGVQGAASNPRHQNSNDPRYAAQKNQRFYTPVNRVEQFLKRGGGSGEYRVCGISRGSKSKTEQRGRSGVQEWESGLKVIAPTLAVALCGIVEGI
ncbi:hypothetical protein K443DRAFT_670634 [Laccaria amethystina LaAM-08-1]|jgi:hypothetical protein|uniref:Uncharacterized protein n=1 Tax=Laccaria amethystina LaAM-08-1 TaxID=1095629 RepID=A0A0C9XCN8_9AGAR|nr:hypothetical protein K443DRAFT_670634 [Laccaria amethystina LaAM-08-1]